MTIQNTILFGNGINRIEEVEDNNSNFKYSWQTALEELAQQANYTLRNAETKPLTLVFEEILMHTRNLSKTDLQKIVAQAVIRSASSQLNDVISCLGKNFLTTNYYTQVMIGNGLAPDHLPFEISLPICPDINENTFSIFRGRKIRNKSIWAIHGSSYDPTSITLGYRQYARYQANIHKYLMSGVRYSNVSTLNSPLYRNRPIFDFEKHEPHYSWVDLFLRDHIHIIGLTLDYSESILWWLMTEKFNLQKKYPKYIGGLTYYQVAKDGKLPVSVDQKLDMLEDLGVKVQVVDSESYKDGYLQIADLIKPGIRKLHEANDLKGMYKLSLK